MSLSEQPSRRLVVAVTGASGAIYAVRLLRHVAPLCERVDVILSGTAPAVLATEMGITLTRPYTAEQYLGGAYPSIHFLAMHDFYTPPASGSYVHDGMIVIPCSMGTIGRIAAGVSDDLIARAADVCLKERRRLIVVPRETPFNLIHLRNMTTLCEAGATILPAVPSFYHTPGTVEDLVDTVVARVLQNAGFPQSLVSAWQADSGGE
jgi:4-hydroxy-3-polyprenylbenzoate decarboxylase